MESRLEDVERELNFESKLRKKVQEEWFEAERQKVQEEWFEKGSLRL